MPLFRVSSCNELRHVWFVVMHSSAVSSGRQAQDMVICSFVSRIGERFNDVLTFFFLLSYGSDSFKGIMKRCVL